MFLARQDIFEELVSSVMSFDADKVMDATRKALSQGIAPVSIIDDGLAKGLRVVGKKFEDGELFLMHLVAAAEAVQRALKELLEPEISKRKEKRESLGRIVLGTVAGDIHDIGKNIVAALLFASGFEVYDLGKDVAVEEFVKKAKEVDANIVGASALLSTTLPMQHEIVKAMVSAGLRNRVKLIFGGAPVTEEWVREIGGDGYGESAVEAVNVAKRVLGIKV